MNCIICSKPIEPGRGGSYCMSCAGMHGTRTWEQIKAIRQEEKKQRTLFEYEHTVTELKT